MTAVQESLYQLHLQGPVMTPHDFHLHNNWPGDRPNFGEGAGAGADGDDDDVDAAAADAFEEDDASD
ncbi:hypothetical protein A2U01_0062059 [Trifolium medium]|uniref:Uncharacterized protein n=1 Tax=Trifolium medium TaxID=97028 RepID=A0A392RZ21_9FABA|nr:hypothetical protein [Trifolium medium]